MNGSMDIFSVVLGALISFGVAYLAIPRIIIISYKKRLFDTIDKRKSHTTIVPRLGGMSFFPAIFFSIGVVLSLRFQYAEHLPESGQAFRLLFTLCAAMLLYLVGVMDDMAGVNWRSKLVVQTACSLIVVLSGSWVDNLYGLLGVHAIPPALGMTLTVFLTVLVINAINLIDGIDGLATGLVAIVLSVTGVIFLLNGQWLSSLIAFSALGTAAAFFWFNVYSSHKIFMGDTGSLTMGMLVSILIIRLCVSSAGVSAALGINPVLIAAGMLLVPIMDVLNVVILRLGSGVSPFIPDRNHIHHRFMDMGFTPRVSMLIIVGLSAFFSASNLLLVRVVNHTLLLCLDMALWTAIQITISRRLSILRAKPGARK